MFDRGFGPDIRKFLGPLKNRATKAVDQGFQTVLVSATMTKVFARLLFMNCYRSYLVFLFLYGTQHCGECMN